MSKSVRRLHGRGPAKDMGAARGITVARSKKASPSLAGSPAFHPQTNASRQLDAALTRDRRSAASREKAAERAARREERLRFEAQRTADRELERAQVRFTAELVAEKIQRRTAEARLRRSQETPADRHRVRLARLKPFTERDGAIQEGEGLFADPYQPGRHEKLTVNRRVDILADEFSKRRISRAQFDVGRMIQAVYEKASGSRGSQFWGEGGSRDTTVAHELAIIYSVETAERVRKFTARLERAIGSVGARFLRAVLVERLSFAQYAQARGKGGERGTAQVAAHFRLLLEGLTEAQYTASGAGRQVPNDKYAARADEVARKEAADADC